MALGNIQYDVPGWVGKSTRNMSKNQRSTMAAVRAAMEAAASNPVNAMGQNSLTPQMAAQMFQNPLMPQNGQLALGPGVQQIPLNQIPQAQRAAAAAARGGLGMVDDAWIGAQGIPQAQQAAAQAARGGGVGRMALGQQLAQSAATGSRGAMPIAMRGGARQASQALVPWVDDAARAASGAGGGAARAAAMSGDDALRALGFGDDVLGAAASAGANLGDDAVRAATGAQAYQAAKAASGGGFLRGTAAGIGGAARANPLGMAAGLGGMGLGMVWNDENSKLDEAASWGLQGAGFGSMLGPLGAAAGGLGGSALGYAMAGDAGADQQSLTRELTNQRTKLTRILEQSGASQDFVKQAQTQLDLMAMNATDKEQIGPLMEQLTAQLIPAVAGDMQQQATQRMREANMAAMQSWMGPMMQDALNRQQYYADQSSAAQTRSAQQFADPAIREAANSLASRTSLNAANSATSQLQQLAAAPGVMGYYTGMDQNGMQPQDLASLAGATPIPAGQDYLSMLLAGQ